MREKYRSDRDTATNNQIKRRAAIVDELRGAGRVHGIIGIGGGTSTLVATSIMKRLPFGMPKVMASPMAAHPAYIERYVGTHDITMHHTVLDIVKINPLLKAQIINAVGAICGMVEMTQGYEDPFDRPCVAMSSFGFGEMAVQSGGGHARGGGLPARGLPRARQGRQGDGGNDSLPACFTACLIPALAASSEHLFKGNRDPGRSG